MTRGDLERALHDLRGDVCVLFAREAMARVEVDVGFSELLERIDELSERAATIDCRGSEQHLLDRASELGLALHPIDKHKGRLFGLIFAANTHGLLINNKQGAACIVPYDDVVGERGNPTAGGPVLVQYFHGKCQLAFQNIDSPTEPIR